MKKNFFRLLACVMAFAMVLSLAACGGKDDDKSSSSTPASSAASSEAKESSEAPASSSEAASSEAATPAAGDKYASVDEFLADPTVASQLETMMSSLGDDMNIDISGDGDKLIYTFTFTEEVDIETTKAAMETEMNSDSFAGTFKDIAASLSEAIEVTNPSVVVTYLAADGTEIYSQEYFPE